MIYKTFGVEELSLENNYFHKEFLSYKYSIRILYETKNLTSIILLPTSGEVVREAAY